MHTQNISHGNPFYFNRNEVIAMNKPLLATYCTNKAIPMLTEEDIRLLDIVYIGFGRVDGTQVCLDELTNLKRMADIRRVNPGIRLILTTASGENGGFPAGTRTEADIRALAVNLAGAVKAYGFDGLDIDWEYPTVNGDPTERHRHTLLLKALREELDKLEGHRTLSIAAGCKTCRPAKKPKNWRCCFTATIGERMPFTVRATTGCLNKSACLRHMIIFTFGWQTKRPTAKAVTSACLPTKAPFPTMPVATARGMFLPASD